MAAHNYKLAVHKAKDIETWANYMENTPKYIRWRPTLILKTIGWAFVVPYLTFKVMQPFYVRTSFCTLRNRLVHALETSLNLTTSIQFCKRDFQLFTAFTDHFAPSFQNYADIQANRNVIDYEQGLEVFSEYGKAGGKMSHSKHTSL
jgi:hypothetical protein